MLYIIDSYAWVEYFLGSEKGQKVKRLFESDNEFVTYECCLAELKGWCIRNNINFEEVINIIEINSEIKQITKDIWINAASIKSEMMKKIQDFGLIDAILLANQKILNCKILTGDKHFKDFKETILV